jgi:hypothetical protein
MLVADRAARAVAVLPDQPLHLLEDGGIDNPLMLSVDDLSVVPGPADVGDVGQDALQLRLVPDGPGMMRSRLGLIRPPPPPAGCR